MARINIEECWWSDPRRMKLILKIGFAADAAAVNMWRTAQLFWGKREPVPEHVFRQLEYANELIECQLAVVRDRSVYVRGSSELLEWHAGKREKAALAGKKSAEVRKERHGTAQPSSTKRHEKPERTPNEPRTDSKVLEPSGSGSSSGSSSSSGLTGDTIRVRETAASAPPHPPPPVQNLSTPPKEPEDEIQTLDDLRRKIPIVTRDAWTRRYPDPAWLEQQIALAFDFHCADPSRRPRTTGQWMKKIITWLSIGWERRTKGETGSMSLTEAAARGLVTL